MPNSGVAQFVGRDDVLTQLDQQLQQSDRVAISTLMGMGGIGKSELALQYAWQEWNKKTYLGGITWLTVAESDPGLSLLSFAQLHLGLTLPTEGELVERVRFCWQNWFKNEQDQALIIFDDVRKLEQIREFLPPQDPHFKVIITTRNGQIARNFQPINLDVLSSDAAVKLLAVFLPNAVENNPKKARELVKWLGYLPLGIELVGRYGQYMNCELAELLEQLQAQRLKDDSLQVPENAFMTAQRGVAAAFELSWQELSASSRLAGEWISLFAESGINEDLILALFEVRSPQPPLKRGAIESASLEKGAIESDSLKRGVIERYLPTFSRWFSLGRSPQPPSASSGQALKRGVMKSGALERGAIENDSLERGTMESGSLEAGAIDLPMPTKADIRHLVNLSLLTEVGNNNYELHTLIRVYLREKLEASPLKEEAKRTYGRVMVGIAQTIDQTLTLADIAKLEPYIDHLKVATEEFHQWLEDDNLIVPFMGLARFYNNQIFYEEAKFWCEKCLNITKERFGEDHPDVATSLHNLSYFYESQGKYAEAEFFLLNALNIRTQKLGNNHPDLATTLNNLGSIYYSQGRYAEAKSHLLQAIRMRKHELGENHPDVARSLNILAGIDTAQGLYSDAESNYLEAIKLIELSLDNNHPDVVIIRNNLALLYFKQKRYSEAAEEFKQSLELLKEFLGDDHPAVAIILNNLANLYCSQKCYPEAEKVYLKAIEIQDKKIQENKLNKNHPDLATSHNNLADCYRLQKNYSKAEEHHKQALDIRKKSLGDDHLDVATSYNNLALVYFAQKRYTEAESLLRKCLKIRTDRLGNNHPDVIASLHNLDEFDDFKNRFLEFKV